MLAIIRLQVYNKSAGTVPALVKKIYLGRMIDIMYVKKENLTALTKVRQELGISREELSKKSGVSYRAIENYEQGRVNINNASVGKVRSMAEVLHVPIEKILD
jgi:DNA-binding XRE family transcriptional regulator